MTDLDMQFGEVEEAPPQRRRRPDDDRHFAVVHHGTPSEEDLPIFVDMDVLADVEAHARTDTSVELGGVLLGGQYLDEDGNPFVMVCDSLRAEHYESSGGHFKFTHDTWTQISRQRDQFSEDLQMVGWYHTHPGLGVFLSSMDRFICDHFYNRPLDVALVIDPVRNDRGWFFWKRDGNEQLPRTGGFTVTASRFRARELAGFVAQLEGKTIMKPESMYGGAPEAAPGVTTQVIHTIRQQMGWMGIAILAVLVLQACLTLLVASRIDGGAEQRQTAQLLEYVQVDPDGTLNVRQLIEQSEAQQKEIERLMKADSLLSKLTEDYEELKKERDVSAERLPELEDANAKLSAENKQLAEQLRQMTESRDEALARAEAAEKEIDRLGALAGEADGDQSTGTSQRADEADEGAASGDEEPAGGMSLWTLALIVALALAAAVIIATGVIKRMRNPESGKD
jgi:proteasome lid subunit RPN8/RPN11